MPGDPTSILLIPGDYTQYLAARLAQSSGERVCCQLSAFFSPPPRPHHITLCWLTLLLSPGHCAGLTPPVPAPASQRPLSRLWRDSVARGPRLPYCLGCADSRGRASATQSLLVTAPFTQAWWPGLTVGIWTPAYLFLASLHISPVIPVTYLDCFLICLLAKNSPLHHVIVMIIIIMLSH